MRIEILELVVVALVGVSGSGKSTFAKRHFKPTEVLSSDYFRALVSDDENNQQVSAQAFDALYYVANKRLELGLLTVIDATNVQKEARASVLRLAKEQNCLAVAIVLNIPEKICKERNEKCPDRNFGGHVVTRQTEQLRRSIRGLQKEGLDDNLMRLKKRSLSKKRNLALNEFALGMESLERFARNEPLYRVHECVFGVLAMESEPVDPRL